MLLFFYPTVAALFGWAVAMWPRQIGHFFFEPKGYDEANGVSFEKKEEIKVGFNLKRKAILFAAWLSVPLGSGRQPVAVRPLSPLNDVHATCTSSARSGCASPAPASSAALSGSA